jgi:hypothetical protein
MEKIQLYEAFFQKSGGYYLEQLNFYEKGKKFRFSYSSSIFGIFWFLYRKMYLEFFIIIAIFYVESIFENLVLVKLIGIEQTKFFSFAVNIILLITMGIIGNNLYIKKAKRTLEKAQMKFTDPDQQKEFLTKKGGTSFLYVIILLTILVLAILLQPK